MLSASTNATSAMARELLSLEGLYRQNVLGETQRVRWQDLVARLFDEQEPTHCRRSFRLPARTSGMVQLRSGAHRCRVHDLSWIGATFVSGGFRYVSCGDPVILSSVQVAGLCQPVDLEYRIVRLAPSAEPPLAGVTLAEDLSGPARARFFKQVYYPLYLRCLCELAHPSVRERSWTIPLIVW